MNASTSTATHSSIEHAAGYGNQKGDTVLLWCEKGVGNPDTKPATLDYGRVPRTDDIRLVPGLRRDAHRRRCG